MNYSIGTMKVHQIFFKNTLRNFCYLISFDDGAIYCIDPLESVPVINYLKTHLNNQPLRAIINTHDHCDHYSGNGGLQASYECPVLAHPNAVIPDRTNTLADHELIYQSGSWSLESIHTPGHTLSHLCVLLKKDGAPFAIFTGDCFFNAGVGNCHNGGDPEVLFQTIETVIQNLPDEVLVYPGHEYLKRNLEFTQKYEPHNSDALEFYRKLENLNLDEIFFINSMKVERKINTFFRLSSPEIIKTLNLENSNKKKVFLTLRELRNRW